MKFNSIKLLAILFLSHFIARGQDTLNKKKPLLLSIGGGYASNRVFGTKADNDETFANPPGTKPQMNQNSSFYITVQLQKQISDYLFVKTGLNYILKQVNPNDNTSLFYKDNLKTSYLSIPFIIGANVLQYDKSRFNISAEFGPAVNIVLSDKTVPGADRPNFKTSPVTLSLCPAATISYAISPKQKLLLNYTFMYDLTNAYTETLYISMSDPNHDMYYRYKTNLLSLSMQWAL